MSDGAWEGLPIPPIDYEKEPLVTSTLNFNNSNLKKAVRWLIDCVQDQQQTLARHGQRLDDAALVRQRPQTTQKLGVHAIAGGFRV